MHRSLQILHKTCRKYFKSWKNNHWGKKISSDKRASGFNLQHNSLQFPFLARFERSNPKFVCRKYGHRKNLRLNSYNWNTIGRPGEKSWFWQLWVPKCFLSSKPTGVNNVSQTRKRCLFHRKHCSRSSYRWSSRKIYKKISFRAWRLRSFHSVG